MKDNYKDRKSIDIWSSSGIILISNTFVIREWRWKYLKELWAKGRDLQGISSTLLSLMSPSLSPSMWDSKPNTSQSHPLLL
jgi:hypothetical protein